MQQMPVLFVAHGAPTLALDADKGGELRRWAASLPRPRAILVASAHWAQTPPHLGADRTCDLIYDFYGFPEPLYRLRYPAPGAPELAAAVEALLEPGGWSPRRSPERGLDHGVWVPLLHMYPEADVPVLQISQPEAQSGTQSGAASAETFFALGQALAPLRGQGVLIVGSGNLTHNLGRLDWQQGSPSPDWAVEFDHWVAERLASFDVDALLAYRHAPGFRTAHPSEEHFTPLLIAAGAASPRPRSVTFPVRGFEFGSLSRRCVQFD